MSWRAKVIWSEGMLLQPQHMQQSERHADYAREVLLRSCVPYGWGFAALQIDEAALKLGRLSLVRASGVFGDGTAFDMPAVDPLPDPIEVPPDAHDALFTLALPLRRAGARETDAEDDEQARADDLVRHRVLQAEVADSNTAGERSAPIELGALHTRLLAAGNATQAWGTLPLARVVERRADNQVMLDRNYIPPVLDAAANELLRAWLQDLIGLVGQRAAALVNRLTEGGTGGVAEVADFLMLQTLNRHEPVLAHLSYASTLHPQRFYECALALAGDLATFRDQRRSTRFAPYRHDDLALSFQPLMDDLRRSLSLVLEQSAIRIDLHTRKHGVRVAVIDDVGLQRNASFILVVHSQLPGETVRSRFPAQVKIGPVERIRELVNLALPGIALLPMPVAPRQIPYHSGASYFELETRNSDLWRQLEKSGGVAMHIAGDFPGLELAFWAIRS